MPSHSPTRRDFLRSTAAAALGAATLAPRKADAATGATVSAAPLGRPARIATVCQAGGFKPTIAENLDFVVSHIDFNYSIPDRIKAKYGDRVDVRRPNPGSNHLIVEPRDPAITCRQLQEEFGFESTFEYHDRHRLAYRHLRVDRELPLQHPLHGDRPQHRKA